MSIEELKDILGRTSKNGIELTFNEFSEIMAEKLSLKYFQVLQV